MSIRSDSYYSDCEVDVAPIHQLKYNFILPCLIMPYNVYRSRWYMIHFTYTRYSCAWHALNGIWPAGMSRAPKFAAFWRAKMILALRIRRKNALRVTLRRAYHTLKNVSLTPSRTFLASAVRPDRHMCHKVGSVLWKRWILHFSGLP